MIYEQLFFKDFKIISRFLIKINHQYFHKMSMKRRTKSNHNINRF